MKGANWNQRENPRCPSLRGKKNLPKPMGAQILSRKLVRYTSKFNTDKPNSKQLLTPTSRGYNLGYPFLRPFRRVVKSYTYNILVGAHLVENFHNSSVPPPVLYHQSIPKLHSHFLDARFLGWPQLFSCYFKSVAQKLCPRCESKNKRSQKCVQLEIFWKHHLEVKHEPQQKKTLL